MRNRILGLGAIVACGSIASADVVLDQLDFDPITQNSANASQDFEAANDTFDSGVLDDFTVNSSQTRILNVEAMMGGWGSFVAANFTNGIVQGYRVEFFTSTSSAASSLTGDAGSAFVTPGNATVGVMGWSSFPTGAHVVLPIDVTLPGAGTYWVSVIGVMDFGTGGQIGVMATELVLGSQNGGIANPGGGFGFPGNYQIGLGTDANGNPKPLDAEYKIEAVPEPASMIALGIGAAALLARRRRKRA